MALPFVHAAQFPATMTCPSLQMLVPCAVQAVSVAITPLEHRHVFCTAGTFAATDAANCAACTAVATSLADTA